MQKFESDVKQLATKTNKIPMLPSKNSSSAVRALF